MSLEESILNNFGGIKRNNLKDIIQFNMSESDIDCLVSSPYYSPENTIDILKQCRDPIFKLSISKRKI